MRTTPEAILSPVLSTPSTRAPAHASRGELPPLAVVPASSSVIELPMAADAPRPQTLTSRRPGIAARLEQLRAQLARNEYRIDFELLASRIVDDGLPRRGRTS